jgi:predicted dehydrogenase
MSLDELDALVDAEHRSGRNFMMMEAAVFTREFLYVRDLVGRGALGRIQFLRGAHYSDYELWPSWKWSPPMHYATHAVGPLLAIAGTRVRRVCCLGSGQMPRRLQGSTKNPFPVETAILELEGSRVAAEVTRSIFRTVREPQESFSVYGDRASFEWQQLYSDDPVLFRMEHASAGEGARFPVVSSARVHPADRSDLLPESIRFTLPEVIGERYRSFHPDAFGGALCHLVHEFVRSIVEGRPAAVSAAVAADWTAAGICAHESALQHGFPVEVPGFGA